jgi:2-succinyl-5-enolpyruvyl-6-hydroxy-3-cyclohexene-1-carboxylate synthase
MTDVTDGQRSVGVARRFVAALLAHHVTDAVLSPGSRSAALALALHAADAQGLIRLHVRVDEREAAFLALGLAKASGRVVPVITTSGTAVANLHPALLEARHARVRLLAVTADRPGRLRGTGANQTTDQRQIFPGIPYSDRVKTFPINALGGPGHLNLEFDEPLVEPASWDFPRNSSVWSFVDRGVATLVDRRARTVIVAGDGAGSEAAELATRHGFPLLAEPSSGARGEAALTAYRLVLDDLSGQVERVLSFGHATLSRPISRLLSSNTIEVLHQGDQSTYPVPAGGNVTFVDGYDVQVDGDPAWLKQWQEACAEATRNLPDSESLAIARAVWAASDGGLLWVGSSNSIRHLDLVASGGERRVLANRGLAGIDGTISSAIGASLAQPEARPAIAVMGDLTFLHGSNGLLMGPDEPRPDLTIVVANDDGGAIFAGLEQGGPDYAEAFERVFATPTGADIARLCAGYGVPHESVTAVDLSAALADPTTGLRVLEVSLTR